METMIISAPASASERSINNAATNIKQIFNTLNEKNFFQFSYIQNSGSEDYSFSQRIIHFLNDNSPSTSQRNEDRFRRGMYQYCTTETSPAEIMKSSMAGDVHFLEALEQDKPVKALVRALNRMRGALPRIFALSVVRSTDDQNNADGDDIAFSGVFQVGPNEGDTVTIETVRCHPDSLFDSGKKEVVTFEVSDANALAMNNSTIAINLAGTSVNLALADGDDTVAEIVAKMNASTDGTLAAYTYAADGNKITATKDAVGAVANTGNTITMANSTVLTGDVTTQGSAANATADAILDFSTQAGCQDAITTIQNAYDKVAKNRAQLGAVQAQMESTIRNLANVVENTTAARSRIQDADFAAETAALTRAQMLQQAATSILAQANAQPQSVLELIRN